MVKREVGPISLTELEGQKLREASPFPSVRKQADVPPLLIVDPPQEPVSIEQRVRELNAEAAQLKTEARQEALDLWTQFAGKLQHIINNPDIYGAGFADIARGLSSQLEGQRQSLDKILQTA